MKIYLPVNSFYFFKILFGTIILFLSIFFSVPGIIYLLVLSIGVPHAIGSYLGMWRAGKLNYRLCIWILSIVIFVSYWGMTIASYEILWLVAGLLFAFHFLFDEPELQWPEKKIEDIWLVIPSFLLFSFCILSDYFNVVLQKNYLVIFIIGIIIVDILFTKKINWFFIQSKILLLYLVYVTVSKISIHDVFVIFSMLHYIFWFIYPVYKLHKYKREERDGFILILLIVTVSLVFWQSFMIWFAFDSLKDVILRSFLVAIIAHVLTTAPFINMFINSYRFPKLHNRV